jgi:uncharacterized membrane protein YjjP (DUF1212 family)
MLVSTANKHIQTEQYLPSLLSSTALEWAATILLLDLNFCLKSPAVLLIGSVTRFLPKFVFYNSYTFSGHITTAVLIKL